MMAKQVFLSVILILCILKLCEGYYWYWYTTERMKRKVTFLSRELILEATRNYQRIDHIKEYYASSPVWDIGQMLYYIRSKYARMVRVYILSIENDKNIKFYNFHLHLPALKEIHHLGMDIYNLVEMLEEYEVTEDINPIEKLNAIKKKKAEKELQKNLTAIDNMAKNAASASNNGGLLRKRPINKSSFKNQGFYARKPIRMNANRPRDIGAKFDSDIE